jgi:hypothetical protein
MTHTIRCWLTKVRHDSDQELPPIPSDFIGIMDWVPEVEKILAEGTTRKETGHIAQEQSGKHTRELAVTERKIEPVGRLPEARHDNEGHREFLDAVARGVHDLVQDPSNRKEFRGQLSSFRRLRDEFARALKEAQEAALADPALRYDYDDVRDKDEAPPDPP